MYNVSFSLHTTFLFRSRQTRSSPTTQWSPCGSWKQDLLPLCFNTGFLVATLSLRADLWSAPLIVVLSTHSFIRDVNLCNSSRATVQALTQICLSLIAEKLWYFSGRSCFSQKLKLFTMFCLKRETKVDETCKSKQRCKQAGSFVSSFDNDDTDNHTHAAG